MAQTQLNAKDLSGFNIYHTKNQTVYWDTWTKTAYIISQSDVSSFSTWQLRLPLAVMMSMIMILLGISYALSFGAALAVYAVAEIIFRVKYLPGLPVSLKWQKPKSEGFIRDTAKKYNFASLLIIAIMFVLFAVLFIIDVVGFRTNTTALIIYIVLLVLSVAAAIVAGIIAATRKKMDKEKTK